MAEPNYFTCTLGQAAALGIQQPHQTVTSLIDALAAEAPDTPAVGFPKPGSRQDEHWSSLLFTFHDIKIGSELVAGRLLHDNEQYLSRRQTVALLCPSTPEFLFTWLALMRLGHAVLLIAPQCQPTAIASLCQTCEVSLLFYDEIYRDLAREASRTSSEHSLQVAGLPFPEDPQRTAFIPLDDVERLTLPAIDVREHDVAYLHHTSGTSSGMPKPIPQTHRAGVGVLPVFADGKNAATFTTTPLYHGGIADLFRAWTSKALIWLFPGKNVPITAANIRRCLAVADRTHEGGQGAKVEYFSSVPYVLQSMEADADGLKYLQRMSIVGVGGAALPSEVGDRLVERGVRLVSRFGSAECGFLLSSHRVYDKDGGWQYLRIAPGVEQYLRLEGQQSGSAGGEELAELVVLKGWPHMAKRNREDGSYATADLFAKHPNIEGAWRYHSRADSQLTLITGKKFDPAPLESSLCAATELLEDVMIFGNNRPYPGALLFRSQAAGGLGDVEFIEHVWPAVEKLNDDSQNHARVGKGMLVPMTVLEKPLEKSSKGTILRGSVEKRFHAEVEGAYAQADGRQAGDCSTEDVSDENLVEVIGTFVGEVVAKGGDLGNDTELFAYGVDSLAGMRIRAKLRRLLPPDTEQLPINVVEDCGTVERLAEYVKRRRHGETEVNGHVADNEHKYMLQLVEEYSRFDERSEMAGLTNGHGRGDEGEVVVLTGATGALGAHVLNQYRQKPQMRKIYCLVRGANEHAARERVNKALLQRQLQPLGIDDEKVIILQAALGEATLGLSTDVYNRVASEATVIMHVAWSVNFRMKLRSFVKDNIAGVKNLLNLALASPSKQPARFAFCSSVASVMAFGGIAPERIIDDPTAATELGYSQSKWVAEHICQRAAETTRLRGRVSIFRVGQLGGDSLHGSWNTKEAWPMMLSAVKVTGSLPDLEREKLDWLPVNIAASALIQGAEVDGGGCPGAAVYHVVNEHKEPTWADLLVWLKKHQGFDVVTPAEWVGHLDTAVNEGSTHPAGQLLDHWRLAYATSQQRDSDHNKQAEEKASHSFETVFTKRALPALRNVEPVDQVYFDKLWNWISTNVG